MPPLRRLKFLLVLVFLGVVLTLYYTSSARNSRSSISDTSDFYSRTLEGLDKHAIPHEAAPGKSAEEAKGMQERLKEAAQVAKDNANAKAPKPDPPSAVVGKGNSAQVVVVGGGEKGIAGRKKFGGNEEKEEREAEVELNSILKKSPIIVFSKSYCPYSKKAKMILEKYDITPAPFIVELDEHPLGPALQARLGDLTGRRTVPNVLINAVSIGGGDDVAAMDGSGMLANKILELGAKKLEITAKSAVEEHGMR
ncbi:thioredoxin-like protein [Calycina marina]|uniref:Thioredoxin-like protein n=1 Tax=Calycina marina TaxID=1763456 RepID=A0A9P7ZBS8_9HELO|nr:thioredoxin-like protein [Calycina marina]